MDIYQISSLRSSWTAVLQLSKMQKVTVWAKKDIMKIECPIDIIDLDILGFIDHNITDQHHPE